MSVCYGLIMQDDFEWYTAEPGTNALNLFLQTMKEKHPEVRLKPLAAWSGFAVYEMTGAHPEDLKSVILKFCTTARYYAETSPYELVQLRVEGATDD